jgi:hypothetical protein
MSSFIHQVPKTPKRRKGGQGGNDENAPPGQDSAAQMPAAVKKGRALKEEATPAVRKSTRHHQNILRLVLSSRRLYSMDTSAWEHVSLC